MKSRFSLPFGLLGAALGLVLTSCAAPRWHHTQRAEIESFVEEELGPELGSHLVRWTQTDLPVLSRLAGESLPERNLHIYCGTPEQQGGQLHTLNGEVGRFQVDRRDRGRIDLVAVLDPNKLRSTLRHELVHHLLHERGYPEWLNEGLAEHLAYSLGDPPPHEDLHHLLHAGLVIASWGSGLVVRRDDDGSFFRVRPDIWLPSMPELLRMNYEQYEEVVLSRADEIRPEFHSVSHLLTRVLMERAGESGPRKYLNALAAGDDAWQAYLRVTRFTGAGEVLLALESSLLRAVEAYPHGVLYLAEFARSRCLSECLPEVVRNDAWNLSHIEAIPGSSLIPLAPVSSIALR